VPLFFILITLVALPNKVPLQVEPYGQAKSEHQISSFLNQYCAAIKAWNKSAFSLCIESGTNINQAVVLSNKHGCSEGDTSSDSQECLYALTLYRNNFRLWQGSVDNIQRAKGYLLAAKNKKPASANSNKQTSIKKSKKTNKNLNAQEKIEVHPELKKNQTTLPKPKKEPPYAKQDESEVIETLKLEGNETPELNIEEQISTEKLVTTKKQLKDPLSGEAIALEKAQMLELAIKNETHCLYALSLWSIQSNINFDAFAMHLLNLQQAMASEDILLIETLFKKIERFQPKPLLEEQDHCIKLTSYQLEKTAVLEYWLALKKQKESVLMQANKIVDGHKQSRFWMSISFLFFSSMLVFLVFILKKSKK